MLAGRAYVSCGERGSVPVGGQRTVVCTQAPMLAGREASASTG